MTIDIAILGGVVAELVIHQEFMHHPPVSKYTHFTFSTLLKLMSDKYVTINKSQNRRSST